MKNSLSRISGVISIGTILSKAGGMARQILIAAVFGVGTIYDAYNYAYILPGFFLVLIGGINGPLHNAIVTILSRKGSKDSAYILSAVNTYILLSFILISLFLFFEADLVIRIVGPGLDQNTHIIAVNQLKIMSPIILLSGFIGTGFGALNAKKEFLLPSLSPIISSIVLILAIVIFWLDQSDNFMFINIGIERTLILAQATLIGAIIQFLVQIPILRKKGLFKLKLIFNWRNSSVHDVWKIIIPASLSSGMLQINVFTDLFFASNIVSAAAGLSYANFLVQAPLGLLSNAILLPLLPIFSTLNNKEDLKELTRRIRQGFIYCSASMIFIGSMFIALSVPITTLFFARGVFDSKAIMLVSKLLICYGIGMPAYLIRDLLVRIFYSIGKSNYPFKISLIAIFINIALDWSLIGGPTPFGRCIPLNLGAEGIVLATVIVNIFSSIKLFKKLSIEINSIPLKKWSFDFIKLIICGLITGLFALKISEIYPLLFNNFLWEIFLILVTIILSFFIFTFLSKQLGIKEIGDLSHLFRGKFNPHLM